MDYSKTYIIGKDIHVPIALDIAAATAAIIHASPGIDIKVKDSSNQQLTNPISPLDILAAGYKPQKDSEIEVIVSGEFPQERLVEVADCIGRLFSKN